jgi:hypothetical protein
LRAPLAPGAEGGDLGLVVGEVDVAGGDPADVLAELVREAGPDGARGDGEGDLAEVAAVLAHPAPVAAGLLAGDAALLEQDDVEASAGEVVGGAGADDATAHHDDVRGVSHRDLRAGR